VLAILHAPTAAHARIMADAGCEAAFVGTSGVVGTYTGLADVGTATMTECVQIAGWIAQSVNFPIIIDGDTGHGGIMAVRRLVRECIHAGIAGIRIDDQPIEGKRKRKAPASKWCLSSRRSHATAPRWYAQRDRSGLCDYGAVLRTRCCEQQFRRLYIASQGL
jgi:hypothetical protein